MEFRTKRVLLNNLEPALGGVKLIKANFMIDAETWKALKDIAVKRGTTSSEIIRVLITDFVEKERTNE